MLIRVFGKALLIKRKYSNKIIIRYPKQVSPYVVILGGEKFMEENTEAMRPLGQVVDKSAIKT